MIEVTNICKRFPGNRHNTLTGANWDLQEGEIHVLLGENGAGKSTLMHILGGFVRPDAGKILLQGTAIHLANPAAARKKGIGMVRQHPELYPELRVWEDAALTANAALKPGLFFNARKARQNAAELVKAFNLNLPLDCLTSELSDAGKHTAAILAVLLSGARYLFFDEPTALLNTGEAAVLGRLFQQLALKNYGIALITHNLDEALRLAARITVMRNGRTLATRPVSAWTAGSLAKWMFGKNVPATSGQKIPRAAAPAARRQSGPPALRVTNLNVLATAHHAALRNICLKVYAGEIVGITGLPSDGIETLELALCGYTRPKSGEIAVSGKNVKGNPLAFRDAGGSFLASGQRRSYTTRSAIAGFDRALSLYDNLIVHHYARVPGTAAPRKPKKRTPSSAALRSLVNTIKSRARIKLSSKRKIGVLSGGMLQRLILERELESAGTLLVISGAFWGLDLEQRQRLKQKILTAARGGGNSANQNIGALLFAPAREEIRGICDRILTLKKGRLYAIVKGNPNHR